MLILQQHLFLWWLGRECWPGELCWGWALLPPAPPALPTPCMSRKRSHQHLGPGPVAMEMDRLSAHIFGGKRHFRSHSSSQSQHGWSQVRAESS